MGAKPERESGSGQKRDTSKVKFFACKRMGHYAGHCPNMKKRSGGTTTTTDEAEFQAQFERECAFLICCTSIEMTANIWYIDSGPRGFELKIFRSYQACQLGLSLTTN
jgi:hypothetical protein